MITRTPGMTLLNPAAAAITAAAPSSAALRRDFLAGRLFGTTADAFARIDSELTSMAGELIALQRPIRNPSPLSASLGSTPSIEAFAPATTAESGHHEGQESPQADLAGSTSGSSKRPLDRFANPGGVSPLQQALDALRSPDGSSQREMGIRLLQEIFASKNPAAISNLMIFTFARNITDSEIDRLIVEHRDLTQAQLVSFLKNHNSADSFHHAARLLLQMGGTVPADAFAVRLNDPDQATRNRIALLLAEHRYAPAIPKLIEMLGQNEASIGFDAARALRDWDEALPPLVQALDHPNPLIRKQAARTLGKGCHAAAADALYAHLGDPSPATAEAMLYALACLRDQRAIAPLIEKISQGAFPGGVCWGNPHPLDKIPESFGPLIGLLDHPNEVARSSAMKTLEVLMGARDAGAPALAEPVVDALARHLHDSDDFVREGVVRILARMGDERAVPHLIESLASGHDRIWGSARDRLADFPGSASPLLRALEVEDLRTRQRLISALHSRWQESDEEGKTVLSGQIIAQLKSLSPQKQLETKEFLSGYEEMFPSSEFRDLRLRERFHQFASALGEELWARLDLAGAGAEAQADLAERVGLTMGIEIEELSDVRQLEQMLRSLNFLVHHEIAHLMPGEFSLDIVRNYAFPHEDIRAQAEEVAIDGMAFDIGRRIYVHGDGDMLFDEETREAISIRAALALYGLVMELHESGARAVSNAMAARAMAVMEEMAESGAISSNTRAELRTLGERYRHAVLSDVKASKKYNIENRLASLVKEYRSIFRQAAAARIGR